MKFWQRLRVYLIGMGIGILLSLYFFGDRGCNWLPSNTVREAIKTSKFKTSELIDCKLICNGFNAKKVATLISKGDIIFSESNAETDPREYKIELEGKFLWVSINTDYKKPAFIMNRFESKCDNCDSLSNDINRKIELPFDKVN